MGRGTEEKLSARLDKTHVLFGGTKILQHTPDKVVMSFNHVNLILSHTGLCDVNTTFYIACSRHFI